MGLVGMNKLQERFAKQGLETKNPSQTEETTVEGWIVKAYDSDEINKVLDDSSAPVWKRDAFTNAPGLVWAEIFYPVGNKTYLLAALDPAEDVYGFGDATLLERRRVTIVFNGISPQGGRWKLARDAGQQNVSLNDSSETYDIGGIV